MSVMHDFETDDLSFSFAPSNRPASFSSAEPASSDKLLHAIACEVAGLAGLISAATSVVNRISALPPELVRAETLAPTLPPEPVVYPALVEHLATADLPADLFSAIQHFYTRLTHAVRLARTYSSYPADLPFKGGVHIEVLVGAWRDLAEHAIDLIEQLGECGALDGRQPHAHAAEVDEALARAADGGWPCVMEDGSVEVPGLAERRRHARHCVSWPARLLHLGNMLAIRIENVSTGGFALNGRRDDICVGSPVVLELMGRMLTAHVVWQAGVRFGIKLVAPLRPNDPILQAAAQAE